MYKYNEGSIKFDDIELKNIDSNSLSNSLSILFQDYNKYELTLRENIGFGSIKNINEDDKIIKILEEFNLDFLKQGNRFNLE